MSPSAPVSLALAIGLGLVLTIVASRMRLPAILLLLGAGVLLGVHGVGVIDAGTLGGAFDAIVEVAIGLLVFEGALHLSARELGRAPRAVAGLLTVGVVVTGIGVAVAAHYILGMDWSIAAVLGAILTVTGPTVIQPILRRLPLRPGLHLTLRAEGILIDPIGVLATAIAAAVALGAGGADATPGSIALAAMKPIGLGLFAGAVVGGIAAIVHRLLSSRGTPREGEAALHAIGACMVAVGAGEMLAHNGGLFAAAACGMMLAGVRSAGIGEVHRFGEQIATLLVGMLFILLASRIDPSAIVGQSWSAWLFVAVVMFLVRPANVLLSTIGSTLSLPERAFASIFAPRGIVAASVAALVGTRLAAATDDPERIAQAALIEPLVFATILATVTWAVVAASPAARLLGVAVTAPPGVVLIGAHRLARDLARVLSVHGVPTYLVDSSASRIREAQERELHATRGDATNARTLEDSAPPNEIGWMIAWTGNEDVDGAASRWGRERFGAERIMVGLGHVHVPKDAGHETEATARLSALEDLERRLTTGEIVVAAGDVASIPHPVLTLRGRSIVALGAPPEGASREQAIAIGIVPREVATELGPRRTPDDSDGRDA